MTGHDAPDAGVALVSAIMLVALMALTALAVLENLAFSARLAANVEDREQATLYALGAEELAAGSITELRRLGSEERYPQLDVWLKQPFQFPIESGLISGRARDGSNCFNLNALVDFQGGVYVANDANRQLLENLLVALGLPQSEAEGFSTSMADFVDSDDRPGFGGAEDDYYGALDTPHRTPNEPISDLSEVELVRGATPEIMALLSRYACLRPALELNQLNLNTLEDWQAPLLGTYLGPDLGTEAATRLIADRPLAGFNTRDAFLQNEVFIATPVPGALTDRLVLVTEYVGLDVQVSFRRAVIHLNSVLQIRDSGDITILSRRYGSFE